jgi:peptidoglycan pentaglycine glycine transferase (the first glycine)
MVRVLSADEAVRWNEIILSLPNAHILQTREWGKAKSVFSWQALPLVWQGDHGRIVAAAMVLQRGVHLLGGRLHYRILYVPKGPLCDWRDKALRERVLSDLTDLASKQGAIFLKIDPDVNLGFGPLGAPDSHDDSIGQALVAALSKTGWLFSNDQIQFRNTVVINLRSSKEDLLAGMKQKTRYNIRLASRKGVTVRLGDSEDFPILYHMYAETSVRDGFVIREEEYYRTIWSIFMQSGMAQPFIAEVANVPVSGLWIFWFANKAYFLYGMSSREHRDKMPNYLLQWEAMQFAKAKGCVEYDLWGAPDVFDQSDPLWGVYRFKEGLGGQVIRHVGAWDLPLRPRLYYLYTQLFPRVLSLLRRHGELRSRRIVA